MWRKREGKLEGRERKERNLTSSTTGMEDIQKELRFKTIPAQVTEIHADCFFFWHPPIPYTVVSLIDNV